MDAYIPVPSTSHAVVEKHCGTRIPVPLESHALIEMHYEATYAILKKNLEDQKIIHERNLEDQYMVRKKNLEDVITALEQLNCTQSEKLAAYKQQIRHKDSRIRDLQNEVVELKDRMTKVAEMTRIAGGGGNERETSYDLRYSSDSGGNINTISRLGMPRIKSDSRLKEEKQLPRRPKFNATGVIDEIENLMDGLGSRPGTSDSHAVADADRHRISSPSTHAPSRGRGSAVVPPRLRPIGEYGEIPNSGLGDLSLRGSKTAMEERARNGPSLLSALSRPLSLTTSENTHPLFRRISPPRASSAEYPRGADKKPLSAFITAHTLPAPSLKETFIEKLKTKQGFFHAPKPQQPPEPPEPEESDSVIRFKVRTEAERRKAASFGPEDRIKKSDIVHTMTLSPTIESVTPKTGIEVMAGAELEKSELDLRRSVSDDSKKKKGGGGSMVRGVVRRWRSDVWKNGLALKRSGSPTSSRV